MFKAQWVRDFFSSVGANQTSILKSRNAGRGRRPGRSLGFESLEGRRLLAADPGALITGIAFADVNNSGLAAGQPVLASVSVALFKDGGNNVFDGGIGGGDDVQIGASTLTNGSGRYSFAVDTAGTYFVQETPPTGYIAPTPTAIIVSANSLLGVSQTTIDDFDTVQTITATPAANDTSSSIVAPEAIGGHRDFALHVTSAAGLLTLSAHPVFDATGEHLLHFDTSGDGTGSYIVGWDGEGASTPPALAFTGLGGVNLTAGGATGIELSIGTDHAGVTASIRIYKDATNFSLATFTVPVSPLTRVFVPFTDFAVAGGTGADFINVGAIQMTIDTTVVQTNGQVAFVEAIAPTSIEADLDNTPQTDLSITKTDGKTSTVPGETNTYTMVVTNVGPLAVTGATVADTYPGIFTNVTYTAVATGGATGFTANGTGNINDAAVSMPVGSTITYTVLGTVSAAATGNISNTATVAVPAGFVDPTPANNTATDTDTLAPAVDLSISKTDGKGTAIPGTTNTYTIVVSNPGPSNVTGATVTDPVPANLTNVTYSAVATGGATGFTATGTGAINDTVTMPAGSTITYTFIGTVLSTATGIVTNTATVAAPQGVQERDTENNSDSDTDELTPQADLQITKTDNKTSIAPGAINSYTIVVTNVGPSAVTGASIADAFPAIFTNATYVATATGGATGFTASGTGNIADTVNMPVGSTITYTVAGAISQSASGNLVNTATVTAPQGTTDPTPGNNTATDTDTIVPTADLQITKTDGKTTAIPGTTNTYTIVVTNAGPSAVTGATVSDTFPASLTNVTFTATATGGATGFTASGTGNSINDTVNMPNGSTITYTVTGTISASASGAIANTATVAVPAGVTDPTPANNTATDSDALTRSVDLQVTKTDNKITAVPGTASTYVIVVTNAGPSDVIGASVTDTFPAGLTNVTFTAVATGGATGFTASGSGSINDLAVNMPLGSTITYTVNGTVSASATGTLTNTVTVNSTATDPTPDNNTATDTDTLTPQADLQITKTDNKTTAVPGNTSTYVIVVTNTGPSAVTGAAIADTFPAGLTNVTFTAAATGGATGFTATGTGNINDASVNMPAGSTVTYTVTGTVSASATGTIANTATVTAPQSVTDPTPGNNTASDTDTLTPQVDLRINKSDAKTTIVPGVSNTYTVIVENLGPSSVTGASIVDTIPAAYSGVTFTATATGGATGFSASGNGNINDTSVSMPAGSKITYVITGTLSTTATGNLSNTATVATPSGITDSVPGNNTATDIDVVTPQSDLTITKTDNTTNVVAGRTTTYTIVVTNVGPIAVTGATVTDTFPTVFTLATWTAVGTGGANGFDPSGTGNINDVVNLPVGATITYTVTGTVSLTATGSLANTATVAVPTGLTDPTPNNNAATDSDTITPHQISKGDFLGRY